MHYKAHQTTSATNQSVSVTTTNKDMAFKLVLLLAVASLFIACVQCNGYRDYSRSESNNGDRSRSDINDRRGLRGNRILGRNRAFGRNRFRDRSDSRSISSSDSNSGRQFPRGRLPFRPLVIKPVSRVTLQSRPILRAPYYNGGAYQYAGQQLYYNKQHGYAIHGLNSAGINHRYRPYYNGQQRAYGYN